MAFDEEGQANGFDGMIEICERSYKIQRRLGLRQNIAFDPNIFPSPLVSPSMLISLLITSTPRGIKETLPHALISGGVSNMSFSFRGNTAVREAMHAVFLYHAVQAGMDMGILNAGQLAVYADIPPDLRERVEDVVLNRRPDGTERLLAVADDASSARKNNAEDLTWREGSVTERLTHALSAWNYRLYRGDTEEARQNAARPIDVIEGPLMDGMNVVGDLLGLVRCSCPRWSKALG